MTGLNAYLPPADLKAGEAFLPDRILEVCRPFRRVQSFHP